MLHIDHRYPIDQSIYRELIHNRVHEARECTHTAIAFRRLGYPAIAAWELSFRRKCMRDARLAKALIA